MIGGYNVKVSRYADDLTFFSFAWSRSFLFLYFSRLQAKLGAHRAMLCHFLSLLSSSLGKQQLKTGLSLEEVAAATRSAYLATPEDRLGKARQPIQPERDTPTVCFGPAYLVHPVSSFAVPHACLGDSAV